MFNNLFSHISGNGYLYIVEPDSMQWEFKFLEAGYKHIISLGCLDDFITTQMLYEYLKLRLGMWKIILHLF